VEPNVAEGVYTVPDSTELSGLVKAANQSSAAKDKMAPGAIRTSIDRLHLSAIGHGSMRSLNRCKLSLYCTREADQYPSYDRPVSLKAPTSQSGFCLQAGRSARKISRTQWSYDVVVYTATFFASHCFPFASQSVALVIGKQLGSPEGKANCLYSLFSTGAGEEIRTLDPNLGKVVLYH